MKDINDNAVSEPSRGAAALAAVGSGRGRRRTVAAAGAAAGAALVLGAVAATPALAGSLHHGARGVLIDRRIPGGNSSGGATDPWGGSSAAGQVPTSQPATAAQSVGVVMINTVLGYQNAQAAGTGLVLTSSGQVLTNYHVVEGASTISVTVAATGQTYQATVVGSDPTDDVALVQLTGASGLATITPDKDKAQVGDAVTAVGNAGGTGTLSAAAGTILSLTASVTAADQGSTASETLNSMVETNADVVAGDSGGPLFDAQGEVVGIDTAGSTGGQADSYAIPIQRALGIAQQINSGNKTSTVRIGPAAFLGVQLSSQPVYSQSGYGLSPTSPSGGAVVGSALTGAAAAAAGIQAGDVITSVGGQAISSPADVGTALATANPGDKVAVGWTDQSGQQQTATVTLGASPVA